MWEVKPLEVSKEDIFRGLEVKKSRIRFRFVWIQLSNNHLTAQKMFSTQLFSHLFNFIQQSTEEKRTFQKPLLAKGLKLYKDRHAAVYTVNTHQASAWCLCRLWMMYWLNERWLHVINILLYKCQPGHFTRSYFPHCWLHYSHWLSPSVHHLALSPFLHSLFTCTPLLGSALTQCL